MRLGLPTGSQRIGVPLYVSPTADRSTWVQLTDSSPGRVAFVVANVFNGPSHLVDEAWTSVIENVHATGAKALGYVDTAYFGTTGKATRCGSTSMRAWTSQIAADVDAWYDYYGAALSGIFFDQVQSRCGKPAGSMGWADRYAELSAYVKKQNPAATTVLNPGIAVPQCYEDVADVLVTFEGSYSTYISSFPELPWAPLHPEKIWHLIYGVPNVSDMETVVRLSKRRGAGYVYVTSGTLPNPYDTLPSASYWNGELCQLEADLLGARTDR